ncbi:MAG: protease modulator HflC, partial [Verrucomicrobiales bacterium]
RTAIARHELIEVIRTTRERQPLQDEALTEASASIGFLNPIRKGRKVLEQEIFEKATPKLADFGIELLDIRFKRINYNESVKVKIYDRMISERKQIADRFRSEGEGEAAKIMGKKERDLKKIESEAYRSVQEIRGEADAKATEIYATAYNQSPEAAEYYEFLKTMEAYQEILANDTTLILSTNSDIFGYLKGIDPAAGKSPALPPAKKLPRAPSAQ